MYAKMLLLYECEKRVEMGAGQEMASLIYTTVLWELKSMDNQKVFLFFFDYVIFALIFLLVCAYTVLFLCVKKATKGQWRHSDKTHIPTCMLKYPTPLTRLLLFPHSFYICFNLKHKTHNTTYCTNPYHSTCNLLKSKAPQINH